jgi:hypothetical protein
MATNTLSVLKSTSLLTYHHDDGKSVPIIFWHEQSETKLGDICWSFDGSLIKNPNNTISVKHISDVFLGARSAVLVKLKTSADPNFSKRCFSLKTKQNTFNFSAPTEEIRTSIMNDIKLLFANGKKPICENINEKNVIDNVLSLRKKTNETDGKVEKLEKELADTKQELTNLKQEFVDIKKLISNQQTAVMAVPAYAQLSAYSQPYRSDYYNQASAPPQYQ